MRSTRDEEGSAFGATATAAVRMVESQERRNLVSALEYLHTEGTNGMEK